MAIKVVYEGTTKINILNQSFFLNIFSGPVKGGKQMLWQMISRSGWTERATEMSKV